MARKTRRTDAKAKPSTLGRPSERRSDEWANVLTQLGGPADRRTSTQWELNVVSADEARSLWRGNDLAATIIETKPKEAFRPGVDISVGDKDTNEKLQARLEELCANAKLVQAAQFARAYGGAAIFPVINDSRGSLAAPLAERGQISGIKHLHVFEAGELTPGTFYDDLFDAKFGKPRTFKLKPKRRGMMGVVEEIEIHETRLIVFDGIRVSNQQENGSSDGWGDNVLTRCQEVLRDYGASWGYAAALFEDFSQRVLKLSGLAELMANDGESHVARRLTQMDAVRSIMRLLVLDKDDDFQRVTTSLAGMPEMMDKFGARLAAAARMPVTFLLGISPGGLNATGDSDTRNWYDQIDAERQVEYLPAVERLVRLILLSNDGPTRGREPDTWSAKFNPLYQQSESEMLANRKTQAEIDDVYIANGTYTPEEVVENRWGGDTFSYEMKIDIEARKRAIQEEADAKKEMAALGAIALKNGARPNAALMAEGEEDGDPEVDQN